jgi:hypothetical protein
MKITLVLTLVLASLFSQAEESEVKYVYFEGRAVDIYHNTIEYAHIINLTRRFGVVSDRSGRFIMPVKQGDSLMITHISHMVRFVMIDQEHLEAQGPYEIIMLPRVFELREVVVRPLPRTRLEFKQEFITIDLPPPPDSVKLGMPHINTMVYTGPEHGFGIVMKGPFQTFYDLFSREARQIKKLQRELSAIELQEEIEKRYNHDLVFRLTGIQEEEQREELMQYCQIPVDFILNATEYDLCIAILRCYESFRERKRRTNPGIGF